jgi:Transposase DDE domain
MAILIHSYNFLVMLKRISTYHIDKLLGYVKAYFHLPYRQTEGVVRAHAANKIPSIPNYSTINRRVNKLDIEINEHVGNDIVIALDSTGIKPLIEVNGYVTNGMLEEVI